MRYVLSLFDLTGNMVEPWAADGCICYCVDIQHKRISHRNVGAGTIYFVPADILTYQAPDLPWEAVFAFPPCTDLAVSGARWFQEKGPRALVHALDMFTTALEIAEKSGAPFMVENPVSVASSHLRKPDFSFSPHEYAGYLMNPDSEAYTKRTCLWTGNGFSMPPTKPVDPVLGSKMHLLPPGPERANLRSETPKGFALAVFEHMTANPQIFATPNQTAE